MHWLYVRCSPEKHYVGCKRRCNRKKITAYEIYAILNSVHRRILLGEGDFDGIIIYRYNWK